jgi:hypothetical protein
LEDRLTPAAAPFFSHAALPYSLPPALEQGLKILFRIAQQDDFRLAIDNLNKSSAANLRSSDGLPGRPFLNHVSQTVGRGNHPILASLLSSGDGSRLSGLGDGLLRTEWNNLIATPPVPLAQGFLTTTMILVHNESANPAGSPTLSAGDFSSPPTRLPTLAETLSTSPFNFHSPMTPGKDRSIVFELSPYAPAAPDIVPIPVPHGMDDWFAELFATPSQGPAPGDALGASNDSSDAVRDAVLQMLHEGGMPAQQIGTLPITVPAVAGDWNWPGPQLETQLAQPAPAQPGRVNGQVPQLETRLLTKPDSQVVQEPRKLPRAKLMASSLLGLFTAGMGRAVWHLGRREQRRQAGKDNERPSGSPKPSPSL